MGEGIKVDGGLVMKEASNNSNSKIIITIFSQPLNSIVKEINQESNNLYAEVIGNILAKKLETTTSISAIQQVLEKLEIDEDSYHLADSSGLSRHNLITPNILVELLSNIARDSLANNYKQSLALAGINGTLKNRMTDVSGTIWGKTGTLSGISSLSGYLETEGGETLVFSILVNNFSGKTSYLKTTIDEITLNISSLSSDCKSE